VGETAILIEADHLEDDDQMGWIRASGNVRATYRDFVLSADQLEYRPGDSRGSAAGAVCLERGAYHLRCASFAFDLAAQAADAREWQALVEKQVWLGGGRLHLTPELVVSEEARISPCLQVDPGYWFAGERFEWAPGKRLWNFRGDWVSVVVSGLTVFKLPFLVATIGEEARRRTQDLRARDLEFGYNGAQGVTLDSKVGFQVGDRGMQLPIRVMSGRGLALGLAETFRTDAGDWRLDGNYTQYWPWLTPASASADAGRAGGHLNGSWAMASGSMQTVLNLGYRVDLGLRNDREYQVDPSGFPVHKVPELLMSWNGIGRDGWSLAPSLRTGYLHEDLFGNGAFVLQGNLGLGLPAWQGPGGWSVQPYAGAVSTAYGAVQRGGAATRAVTASSQNTINLGLLNAWSWGDSLSIRLSLDSQPVFLTAGGSPFVHDRASGVDRILTDLRWHVWGPWSTGVSMWWARPHDQPWQISSYALGDLAYRLEYGVNCLGFGLSLRPPRGLQPFQATFDYNLVAF
jgi:hypothetical protein